MPGNKRNNLFESILSNVAPPVGGVNKAYFHLKMGESKYLPHYKSSSIKWVFELHVLLKSIIEDYQFTETR